MNSIKLKRKGVLFPKQKFDVFYFNNNIVILSFSNRDYFDYTLPFFSFLFLEKKKFFLSLTTTITKNKKESQINNLFKKLFINDLVGSFGEYKRILIIIGIGFKFNLEKDILMVFTGSYIPKKIKVPFDIHCFLEDVNKLVLSSKDKKKLSFFASYIKSIKPWEKYKGKGLRYLEEKITLKKYKKAA